MNRAIWMAALLGALSSAGCNTEAYCFEDCERDGTGYEDAGPSDAAWDAPSIDAPGPIFTIDSGADSGEQDAGPCSNVDLQSDPKNCGSCGNVCVISGAFPRCVAGECQIASCAEGRSDLDQNVANGCEYKCNKTSETETCDLVDNNCDGRVDEGFDLTSDPNNCGLCGHRCDLPSAASACAPSGGSASCVITSCAAGYHDLNGIAEDGCEYACTPSNGGVETCDTQDNDCDGETNESDDPSTPQVDGIAVEPCTDFCPGGVCAGRCTAGQLICVGTQSVCVPGVLPAIESCNNLDDDCNGQSDESFDLDNDPSNCGGCGIKCSVPNAIPSCVSGSCAVKACLPGTRDYDPSKPGCEVCPVSPVRTETCNGLDDDCDGVVDNAATISAQKPPPEYCANRAGTPCQSSQVMCSGSAGWTCSYGAGVELGSNGEVLLVEQRCDGQDGNCDGNVDEAFLDLGESCTKGVGACEDHGVRACDPSNPSKTYCDYSALPDPVAGAPFSSETCNGEDDDCDGEVDEQTDNLVRVTKGATDFWIDRFEAARPDASASDAGQLETHVCTRAGVLPWANASYAEAAAACAASGRRLCTATELVTACAGASGYVYPYGNTYQAATCNGLDHVSTSARPTGSGSSCVSSYGVYDLSGNVSEWTSTVTGNTGAPLNLSIMSLHGGSFLSPAAGLACGFAFDRMSTNAVTPSIGFRCCKNP